MDNRIIQRVNRIGQIKIILKQCKKEKRALNRKDFLIEIMRKFECSEKTAREYLSVADENNALGVPTQMRLEW